MRDAPTARSGARGDADGDGGVGKLKVGNDTTCAGRGRHRDARVRRALLSGTEGGEHLAAAGGEGLTSAAGAAGGVLVSVSVLVAVAAVVVVVRPCLRRRRRPGGAGGGSRSR